MCSVAQTIRFKTANVVKLHIHMHQSLHKLNLCSFFFSSLAPYVFSHVCLNFFLSLCVRGCVLNFCLFIRFCFISFHLSTNVYNNGAKMHAVSEWTPARTSKIAVDNMYLHCDIRYRIVDSTNLEKISNISYHDFNGSE